MGPTPASPSAAFAILLRSECTLQATATPTPMSVSPDATATTSGDYRPGPRRGAHGHLLDRRDPFGRCAIGVKRSDDTLRTAPDRPGWRLPDEIEQVQAERQDINAARLMAQRSLDNSRRLIERGREDQARVNVERELGAGYPLEQAMADWEAEVTECAKVIGELDHLVTCLLWAQLYPDAPSPDDYRAQEEHELREGGSPLRFDHTDALRELLWSEIVSYFADQGFGENAEILAAMEKRLGLGGVCQLVAALREENVGAIQQMCDLVTDEERRAGFDCHNRLLVRRGAGGNIFIVIDQPGNPEYMPPLVARRSLADAVRRWCRLGARSRDRRPSSPRRRGSRRGAPAPRGGDPPDGGEPEPHRNHRRRYLAAGVCAAAGCLWLAAPIGAMEGSVTDAQVEARTLSLVSEHRQKMQEIEVGLDDLGIEAERIFEVVQAAMGWFDPDSVPFSDDPDDFCAEYDSMLWDTVTTALKKAGLDPDHPAIWDCAWEDYYEAKSAGDWVGQLRLKAQQDERNRRERLARRKAAVTRQPVRRCGARQRSSRGKALRRRGSRRCTARASGGGSSGDDPPGDPDGLGARASEATRPTPVVSA